MRTEMAPFVSACERYNQNGTIGKFVVDEEVKAYFIAQPNNYFQKAFCLFLRHSDDAAASGKNDPQLAHVKKNSNVPDMEKLIPDGYVLVSDPTVTADSTLRCRNTFSRVSSSSQWVVYQGNGHYMNVGHGPGLSCEFTYKHHK